MEFSRRVLLGALFVGSVVVVDGFLLIEQENTAEGMVWIDADPQSLPVGELPANLTESPGFWIDTAAITDEEFEQFVTSTGYVASEQWQNSAADPQKEWVVTQDAAHIASDSNNKHGEDNQFANQDARAYCRWLGKQLSSDLQTELARQGAATQISHDGFRCVMHHRTNNIAAIWLN